jgi:hypothetical protein
MTEAAKLITMARYLARQAIKDHLRDCGIRSLTLEASEINKMTDAYLMARRAELIEEAKAILSRQVKGPCNVQAAMRG